MAKLSLTAALGDYDHVRDLGNERVQPEGIQLRLLNFKVEEIFFRFFENLEWDVSEMSMGMYVSAISRGDTRFIAIPVFPSRLFRLSAIYIRSGSGIENPEDLQGKRVGIPQWSQTATIYVRGYLSDTKGVPLADISWVQAGVDEPGRPEYATLRLPEGVEIISESKKSLNEMLLSGEIDAVISARPPKSFIDGNASVSRLFPDYRKHEEAFFADTGIFPIMHTVVIRRDVYEADRWIARNLLLAFDEAKKRSVARMLDHAAAHVPLPWAVDLAEQGGRGLIFKESDFWPYGVRQNHKTLDSFLRYAYEQGVCHRRLSPEEIFAKETLSEIRI